MTENTQMSSVSTLLRALEGIKALRYPVSDACIATKRSVTIAELCFAKEEGESSKCGRELYSGTIEAME